MHPVKLRPAARFLLPLVGALLALLLSGRLRPRMKTGCLPTNRLPPSNKIPPCGIF